MSPRSGRDRSGYDAAAATASRRAASSASRLARACCSIRKVVTTTSPSARPKEGDREASLGSGARLRASKPLRAASSTPQPVRTRSSRIARTSRSCRMHASGSSPAGTSASSQKGSARMPGRVALIIVAGRCRRECLPEHTRPDERPTADDIPALVAAPSDCNPRDRRPDRPFEKAIEIHSVLQPSCASGSPARLSTPISVTITSGRNLARAGSRISPTKRS